MWNNPEAATLQGQLWGSRANVRDALAAVDERDELLRKAYAEINLLRAQVARYSDRINGYSMNLDGARAKVDAFMAAHPTSPLLADSGKRFKDGRIKTKLRIIFENAFDRSAAELKISNPAALRLD